MNPILSGILHQLEADPSAGVALIGGALNLLGPALVPMLVHLLPAGPLRTYAEAHPEEVLAFVREAVALVTKHPELVKAAAGQFKVAK